LAGFTIFALQLHGLSFWDPLEVIFLLNNESTINKLVL